MADARHSTLTWHTLVFLAWRNLWRNTRRTMITASTIAIGFALAIVSVGLGDGGHNQMIRNAIRLGEGHVTIQPKGYLEAPANQLYLKDGEGLMTHPPLVDLNGIIAPRIFLQVLAATASNSLGVALQGIEAQHDPLAGILTPTLVAGRWLTPGDARGVVVGEGMARKLKLRVGSKLVIMAGGGDYEMTSRLGRVRGIFHSGMDSLDSYMVLSDLAFARPLLPGYDPASDSAAVTRLAIFLNDPDEASALEARLNHPPLPDDAVAHDWQEMMPELVNYIVVDDAGNYIWLTVILVVVAFGILNTILMSVLERTREFGLVRALGMRPHHLLELVTVETVLLALVSVALGWLVGGSAHLYFALHGLNLSFLSPQALTVSGVMLDPILKSELSWGRVGALTAIVVGTTLVSGIYPAFRAARVSPMAALRT